MIYKIFWEYSIDTDELKKNEYVIQNNINESHINNDSLNSLIDKRLEKYKRRLAEDLKIKVKKIDVEYEKWCETINTFLLNIEWDIQKEHIIDLHKLFFPKDYYWESLDVSWKRFYAKFNAWEFRTKDELVIVDNIKYNYLDFTEIDTAIDNLFYWYNNDNETEKYIKIILFYLYLCEIHPFYNWNWTIALLIAESMLFKNNIDFSIIKFFNSITIQEKLSFFKEWIKWNHINTFNLINKNIDKSNLN